MNPSTAAELIACRVDGNTADAELVAAAELLIVADPTGSKARQVVARAEPSVEVIFEVIGNINGVPVDDAFVVNFGVHAELQIPFSTAVHCRAAVINDLFVIQPNLEHPITSL